ncbi:MAG: tetratricopeptide repeat protein [Bacteroidota bacterium]
MLKYSTYIKWHIAVLITISTFCQGISQNIQKVDSLQQLFLSAKNDTAKARLLIEIGDAVRTTDPDSALYYFGLAASLAEKKLKTQGISFSEKCRYKLYNAHALKQTGVVYRKQFRHDESLKYCRRAMAIYHELADLKDTTFNLMGKNGMANCHTLLGHNYNNLGNYDEAIYHFEKVVVLGESLNDKYMIATAYNNVGNIHSNQGRYDKAIEYFLEALKIKEEINDKPGISACYNNIGIVQWNQGNHEKSIECFQKSLKIYEEINDIQSIAGINNNIGNILADQGNLPEALKYYQKATQIYEELNDKRGLYNCYNNMGILKTDLGELDSSLMFYNKALTYCLDLGDKRGMTMVYGNLANVCVKMAEITSGNDSRKNDLLKKAVEYGEKAFSIADEIGAVPWKRQASEQLMSAYEMQGNNSRALYYARQLLVCKDSMFNEDKTNALEEMQARYESDKKQMQIDKLAQEKELDKQTIRAQQEKNRKQLIILFSALAGFVIVLAFSIIIFRMFRQKKQANMLLREQNEEIRQQKEEILAQRDEIESQRDQVMSQKQQIEELYDLAVIRKNIVEKQNKEIEDSIRYASRIQTATLPASMQLQALLGEYFLFFRPKDVVSGDFYWATRSGDWLVAAVADCTGHGVPGAFMSMLGMSYLNEIVRKKEINDPATILNLLRTSVVEALKQNLRSDTQKDGMDIALCTINTNTMELVFAGANNPIYLLKQEKTENNFTEKNGNNCVAEYRLIENNGNPSNRPLYLYEIKGDKMPVGIHTRMESFISKTIKIEKGDVIYLFSDGMPDQFGGPKEKKFMYTGFHQLLYTIADFSMKDQGAAIEKTYDDWIHYNGQRFKQIDDVTILGFKV